MKYLLILTLIITEASIQASQAPTAQTESSTSNSQTPHNYKFNLETTAKANGNVVQAWTLSELTSKWTMEKMIEHRPYTQKNGSANCTSITLNFKNPDASPLDVPTAMRLTSMLAVIEEGSKRDTFHFINSPYVYNSTNGTVDNTPEGLIENSEQPGAAK
ncbi:MAG: hypothetical protein P4L31_08595 [Candidatus Babeliales bacterium]|nr:hypothetical protein [Candidatus Babeliales bacterium]